MSDKMFGLLFLFLLNALHIGLSASLYFFGDARAQGELFVTIPCGAFILILSLLIIWQDTHDVRK